MNYKNLSSNDLNYLYQHGDYILRMQVTAQLTGMQLSQQLMSADNQAKPSKNALKLSPEKETEE